MPAANGLRRAAFLDRDGVINIDHGYVFRRDDFEFVPGTLAACAQLHRQGLALVVVTNQSGIGRGLYSEDDYRRLTEWMTAAFAAAGAPLAGVYYCPHHPQALLPEYRRACACRKPAPGLLPFYFGDDRTDEDAFRFLRGKGIPVFVGPPETPSEAEFFLADSAEVAEFMKRFIKAWPEENPAAPKI